MIKGSVEQGHFMFSGGFYKLIKNINIKVFYFLLFLFIHSFLLIIIKLSLA